MEVSNSRHVFILLQTIIDFQQQFQCYSMQKVNFSITKKRNLPNPLPENDLSKLSQSIATLARQINSLNHTNPQPQNDSSNDFDHTDVRFMKICADIPQLSTFKQSKMNEIQCALGKFCKKVFESGFQLYKTGELNNDQTKIFCSQKLLYLIIQLARKNQLSGQQLRFINQTLKNKLIPYFAAKYPLSQQKGPNLELLRLIIPKNNYEDEEYDSINGANIKFRYKASKNYNSEIMSVFNFLISNTSKNKKDFEEDIFTIFSQIENQKSLNQMLRFYPSAAVNGIGYEEMIKQIIKMSKEKSIKQQKMVKQLQQESQKKIEYREKVRAYTTIEVCSKKPEHIQTYTLKEIKSENLDISDPFLMRIAIKWSDELDNYYKPGTIILRERPYRMRDDSIHYLKFAWMKNILEALLMRSYHKYVKNFFEKAEKHNYQSQSELSISQEINKLAMYSEEESLVGNFSANIYKISSSYIQGYLNAQIHGIATALNILQRIYRYQFLTQEFTEQINEIVDSPTLYKIEKLIKKMLVFERQKTWTMNTDSEIPELITFRIGDLLRCRCKSKPLQINALYRQMQRISLVNPDQFKIVRVKNRLNKAPKDILINFLYQKSLLIEMQLAIKTQTSKSGQISSNFTHYLYELERAKFGPVSEMCCIWARDMRGKIYASHLDLWNRRHPPNKPICDHHNKTEIVLPFRCSICQYFYFAAKSCENHKNCEECPQKVCFLCQFGSKSPQQKKSILNIKSPYKDLLYEKGEDISKLLNLIPNKGKIVMLKHNLNQTIEFIKYTDHNNIIYLLQENSTGQFSLLAYFEDPQKNGVCQNYEKEEIVRKFFTENLVIVEEQSQNQNQLQQIKQRIKQRFILQKYLGKCQKIQQNVLWIVGEAIDCTIFQNQNYGVNYCPEIINLSQNKIDDVSVLVDKFQLVEGVFLNNNCIRQLPHNLGKWRNLKTLEIDNNRIKSLPSSIFSLKHLSKLNLSCNKIEDIQQIQELRSLIRLDLSHNQLKSVPNTIDRVVNLQELYLSQNQLLALPEEIGNLVKLKKLNLTDNNLTQLPRTIGNLQKLEFLWAMKNKLQSLPLEIGNLTNLLKLVFHHNQLKQLPAQIGGLESLSELWLLDNQVSKIPHTIGRLSKLKKLILTNNKLTEIPIQIGKLNSLESLWISSNQLEVFPEAIKQLQKLTNLKLSHNKLREIPKDLSKLLKLQLIQLSHNQLSSVPQQIQAIKNLEVFHLDSNNIQTLPDSIQHLQFVKLLNLSHNRFFQFPEIVAFMSSLEDLRLSNNQIKAIPQLIKQLRYLKALHLELNEIRQIPDFILIMPSLEVLTISSSYLKYPPNFKISSNLKEIQIKNSQYKLAGSSNPESNKEIKDLSIGLELTLKTLQQSLEQIGHISGLEKLGIFDSNLERIPEQIYGFKNLILEINSGKLSQETLVRIQKKKKEGWKVYTKSIEQKA